MCEDWVLFHMCLALHTDTIPRHRNGCQANESQKGARALFVTYCTDTPYDTRYVITVVCTCKSHDMAVLSFVGLSFGDAVLLDARVSSTASMTTLEVQQM